MELGYSKNLRLYLLTQYNPNTETKLGEVRKKIQEAMQKWRCLQLLLIGKKY